MAKIYCDAIDCAFCLEEEPCIYIIANKLDEENEKLRQRIKEFEFAKHFKNKIYNLV